MEKIFFVVNNNLKEVNRELYSSGGRVKMIQTVSEMVSDSSGQKSTGDVYAYVVVESEHRI